MPENDSGVWISAMKPCGGDSRIISCALDDPDATLFSIHYSGMPYSSSTIDFRQEDGMHAGAAKFRAEGVMYALARAFEAGRMAFQAETRRFLGINQR